MLNTSFWRWEINTIYSGLEEAAMKQAESASRAAELRIYLIKAEKEATMKQAEFASRAAEL